MESLNQTQQRIKAEANFLSIVTILADKYKIKADVDIKNRMVNFIGGTDEEQYQLACEIDDILGNYAV